MQLHWIPWVTGSQAGSKQKLCQTSHPGKQRKTGSFSHPCFTSSFIKKVTPDWHIYLSFQLSIIFPSFQTSWLSNKMLVEMFPVLSLLQYNFLLKVSKKALETECQGNTFCVVNCPVALRRCGRRHRHAHLRFFFRQCGRHGCGREKHLWQVSLRGAQTTDPKRVCLGIPIFCSGFNSL